MFDREECQKDLADLLEITECEMSLKLHGRRKFKLEEIKTLCKHYNRDVNELFYEKRE